MQEENDPIRFPKAQPLGGLFNHFKEYVERHATNGSKFKHIENAPDPITFTAQQREEGGLSDWEKLRQEDWRKRRRAAERDKVLLGLTIYLFDRFIRTHLNAIPDVFLRLPTHDDLTLGDLALTFVREHDFVGRRKWPGENGHETAKSAGAIDFWDLGKVDRGTSASVSTNSLTYETLIRIRLIETAEGFQDRYRLVDTEYWEISEKSLLFASQAGYGVATIATASKHLSPHVGAALFYAGNLPSDNDISKLLGFIERHSPRHIGYLVNKIHRMAENTPLEELYQSDVAALLGEDHNSGPFRRKIWPQFREGLTPEQRERLPKKGRPVRKDK